MDTELFKACFIVFLFILIFAAASYILSHSVTLAIKMMKSAFKNEFKTDSGKLNLISLILLIFLIVFLNIHKAAAIALSPTHSLSDQTSDIVSIFLFCLLATGSLICLVILEYKTENPIKNEQDTIVKSSAITPNSGASDERT
jgi:glucan phosphoethanolaminetransferase (alkaline phosphatase superfamily)